MHKGNYTVSKEANVFLPLGSMVGGAACCFSFVNRIQQRVRGLPTSSSGDVSLWSQPTQLPFAFPETIMIDLTTYRLRIGTFGGGKPRKRTTGAKINTSPNSVAVAVFLLFVVSMPEPIFVF